MKIDFRKTYDEIFAETGISKNKIREAYDKHLKKELQWNYEIQIFVNEMIQELEQSGLSIKEKLNLIQEIYHKIV